MVVLQTQVPSDNIPNYKVGYQSHQSSQAIIETLQCSSSILGSQTQRGNRPNPYRCKGVRSKSWTWRLNHVSDFGNFFQVMLAVNSGQHARSMDLRLVQKWNGKRATRSMMRRNAIGSWRHARLDATFLPKEWNGAHPWRPSRSLHLRRDSLVF